MNKLYAKESERVLQAYSTGIEMGHCAYISYLESELMKFRRPADLPEAGASAERISSVVRSNATTGWISVKDRLPECKDYYEEVVIFIPELNEVTLGIYDDPKWLKWNDDVWETINVTHWMPLPEPPEV